MKFGRALAVVAVAVVQLVGVARGASLTLTSGMPFDRTLPANLITNGSFESGPVGLYWATGTLMTPYNPVPGWVSSGGQSAYARTNMAPGFQNHGRTSLYFGNGIISSVSPLPVENYATGEMTFATPPVIGMSATYPVPVTLSQTVSGLDTTATYLFRFWTTGEAVGTAGGNGFGDDGFFGLDVTGFSRVYLAAPDGGPNPTVGSSKEYQFLLQPAAASTTFKFTNWGHYLSATSLSTELVLDDVSLNKIVPEPAGLALLAVPMLALVRRRAIAR